MDTGREEGTAVEEARMTRFVGFMVDRIWLARCGINGRGGWLLMESV